MANKKLVNQVLDFCDTYRDEVERYSPEVMTFSFMMGLPPEECTGMYPESELGEDFLNDYDDICDLIYRWKEA